MKFVVTLAAALVGAAMGQVETIGVPMGRMLKLAPQAAMMMAEVDVAAAIRDDVNRTKDQEGGMPFFFGWMCGPTSMLRTLVTGTKCPTTPGFGA